jgi:hypothetical protein
MQLIVEHVDGMIPIGVLRADSAVARGRMVLITDREDFLSPPASSRMEDRQERMAVICIFTTYLHYTF